MDTADLEEAAEHIANILSGIDNVAENKIDENVSAHKGDLDYEPMSPGHERYYLNIQRFCQ